MHCARTSPDDAPLYRAVTSSLGTYLFSDTPKGRRAMYCYMQYMTDRFFGMRTDADTLKIYELKHLRPTIGQEHYLTGDEICRRFHVCKRTLQTLRDTKAIPYTTLGGKSSIPNPYLRGAEELPRLPALE